MEKIRIGTLFSGVGTPEYAIKKLGIPHEMVFACEWDKYARTTFNANHTLDEKHFHTDVREMDGTQYRDKVDLMIWGFVCTSFSIAGKRLGFDDPKTGDLFAQGIRIMNGVRPKYAIIENVKNLISIDNGNTIRTVLKTIDSIGYKVYMDIVNTKNYGVPQNRERVYIFCERKD